MACLLLSRKLIPLSTFSVAPMNFNQPWRYPESSYEEYACIVRITEATELLSPQLDDVLLSLKEQAEGDSREGRPVSPLGAHFLVAGWPRWQELPPRLLASLIAAESGHDTLLGLEMAHASGVPLVQLRTIDSCAARGRRVIIRGRAVRYSLG